MNFISISHPALCIVNIYITRFSLTIIVVLYFLNFEEIKQGLCYNFDKGINVGK